MLNMASMLEQEYICFPFYNSLDTIYHLLAKLQHSWEVMLM